MTSMPTFRPLVVGSLVTEKPPAVVVPVMAPAVNESGARELVAVALADSVIWLAESTDAILVPLGMPVPLTTMPAAKVLVEVRLVTISLPLDIVPVMAPAENENATLLALAVGFAESVIVLFAESIETIVVPAGIPAPLTTMPAASVLVEVRLLTTALPLFVVPVIAPEEKVSDTPVLLAADPVDSVIWVAESTDTIVVPA